MALVKCKECGKEVSTKAKNCPMCGAKAPKKTSLFTWLVLLFIIFGVYAAYQSPTSSNSMAGSKASTSPQKSKPAKEIAQPKMAWATSATNDEMTGKLSAFAHSPAVFPLKRMSYPYSDVKSWMGVGCDNNAEWAYFGFSSAPNLAKDETKDGYNLIRTQIKWNNQVEEVTLTQEWGAKFMSFSNDSPAITKTAASSTVLLKLQWHGEQPTYFEYSLNGSSKAIAEIRSKCAAGK